MHTYIHTTYVHPHSGKPTVLEVKEVNEGKDLFIKWQSSSTDQRPVKYYMGTVTPIADVGTKSDQSDSGIITFRTNETNYTLTDIDTTKSYTLVICAHNGKDNPCSEVYNYKVTPEGVTADEEDDGLDTPILIVIIVAPVVVLLSCCVLLFIFFRFFRWYQNYYPEKEGMHMCVLISSR